MAAKVYRLDGRVVAQAEYLNAKAVAAGFPGGRKEREAYRRAVNRAAAKGTPPPRPPTERARYRPASLAPKAVADRKRGKRLSIGKEGAGEYLATGGRKTATKEIQRAARQGKQVVITATADNVQYAYPRAWKKGKATLVNVDPAEILETLQNFGGDLDAAMSHLFQASGDYQEVAGITLFEIKSY